jgi:uncharacterized cupin superfamily protein
MVEEARLEPREAGLMPVSAGWFVVNVRDAAWVRSDALGTHCVFEGDEFLVLAGECLLLVEGEERRLGAWDFVHCPSGTEHIFVGAGGGPCVIFMTGGRTRERGTVYAVSEVARRHGAGVESETTESAEA